MRVEKKRMNHHQNMRLSLRRILFYGIGITFLVYSFFYFDVIFSSYSPPPIELEDESHSYGAVNEIVDPFAYPILIKPTFDPCSSSTPPSTKTSFKNILIVVHARVKDILARSMFRKTIGREWLQRHFGFKIIFVLGQHSSPQFQHFIDQESRTYGDILQGSFLDSYKNLTIKAIVWMKYVSENCAESNPIILKVDDDVLIELERLKETLLQYTEQLQHKYLCYSHTLMLIERSNKSVWYVPETEMIRNYTFYDEYCSGMAYITSTAVIAKQWEYLKTHKVHYHPIDDFFVTGKLAAEVGVGHINEPSMYDLYLNDVNRTLNENGTFFLIHQKNLRNVIWKKMLDKWTKNLAQL